MARESYDIVALGDAIVDVLAKRSDRFLDECGVVKGTMRLLGDAEADTLVAAMHASGPVDEVPGGSAANTLAGAAALGARCAFIGQTGADRLGDLFAAHMHALDIDFATPPLANVPTGRCLILVSPDGERTMQTNPAASHRLTAETLDEDAVRAARMLFLEGYLWGPDKPRAAMRRAIELAHAEGRAIAFTLSDSIALPGRRDSLAALVADGGVDVLFANEYEACLMAATATVEEAIARLSPQVPTLVLTRGAQGAMAIHAGERIEIPALQVEKVVDTTGAGDQFAAGFIAAQVRGLDVEASLRSGAAAAADIITRIGARPVAPGGAADGDND
ncbi:adenosine kinase [Croceicoccus sp. BE223]|uniref:adenosine kinase n=1 Tax=Croceicoccus sp. BE223 TaxID=2817716 RepID=UPI00286080F1|nr:adenosine kinase [Croceicoccus sp. BE223]MDR7101651.1 sugar/nucleoside kinase (ribokinase family) [Croceicoccus sp. BE223]